jgi:hypothetical protein
VRRARSDAAIWGFFGITALVVAALYALAGRDREGSVEPTARKGLAITNAAANSVLLGATAGPAAGLAAGALGLAAADEDTARDPRFKNALGWANWLLPMSWPVSLVGASILAVDLLAHAITGGAVERARVHGVRFDGPSGTVVTEGGILVAPGFHGGFNFGVFSFITPGAQVVEEHEAGHAFNLAAFGWIFHLIGGFDRKWRDDPAEAYAERIAESNRSPSRRTDWVDQWGRPERHV